MFKPIERAFSFINRGLAAILGMMLYPLINLLRLSRSAVTVALIAAAVLLAIPFLAIMAGGMQSTEGASLLVSIGSGIGVFVAIPLIVSFLPVIFGAAAISTFVYSIAKGLSIGWNDGLPTLSSKLGSWLFSKSDDFSYDWFALELFGVKRDSSFSFTRMMRTLQPVSEEEALRLQIEASEAAAVEAARRHMTVEEFDALELSAAEINAIKIKRLAPLSAEELTLLEGDASIARELAAYKALQRLETDDCGLLLSRPERLDTILLVKQYKTSAGKWLPVPGVVNIYDKDMLKAWFVGGEDHSGNATHPINRDAIKNPSPYELDGIEYETRYVFHSYYPQDEAEGPGMCEERNLLTATLRARLAALAPVEEVPDDYDIAFMTSLS